ncbi:MAG TPA: rod shape-determining protein MreD [Gaiellales bacterium]|nr:rod shape-determining protein MreD [Gaiellales bacterium]
MLDYPKALVCVFLLMVLQISVTPQLYPFGGGPDLIAILVVALALWRGLEMAAVTGFLGGLLLDAVLYRHLGMTSLAYLACAWLVATFSGRGEAGAGMLEPAPPRPLPWVIAGALLVQVGLVAVQLLLGESYDAGFLVWHQIVPSLLQTTLLALILLPLLRRLFRPTRARPDVSAAPAL